MITSIIVSSDNPRDTCPQQKESIMKLATALALLSLAATACATTSTPATSSTTPVGDWRRWNNTPPGYTMILPAISFAERGVRVNNDELCHESPFPSEPDKVDMVVRFTAPISGAYSVNPMFVEGSNFGHARPRGSHYVRVDRAATSITCHFNVPADTDINAVHISRLQLWCPLEPTESRSCQYSEIPVATTPEVEIGGHAIQNGATHSFYGAYLVLLQPNNP